jgi:hypothetical protein
MITANMSLVVGDNSAIVFFLISVLYRYAKLFLFLKSIQKLTFLRESVQNQFKMKCTYTANAIFVYIYAGSWFFVNHYCYIVCFIRKIDYAFNMTACQFFEFHLCYYFDPKVALNGLRY